MTFGIGAYPAARRGAALGVAYTGVGLGTAVSVGTLPVVAEALGLSGALLVLAIEDAPRSRGRAVPRRLLAQPGFACLLGFSFLGFFNTYALLTWLPAYLSDGLGASPARAGALAALVNLTLTVSSPLVGKLSDVLPSRTLVLQAGALCSLGAFVMLATGRGVPLVVAAGVLAGVASSMTTAPMMVFAGERFGPGAAGLAVGLVNAVGQTGSALAGVVFGPLLDATGSFAAIWWSCIPVGLVRLALLWLIAEDRPQAAPTP